jgi:uncharacterized protein
MAEFPAHLSAAERGALADFLSRVHVLLGEDLLEARLFGSRARGEGGEGSDLDVALIVTPRGRALRREIHGLTFEAAYDFGVDVEPLVLTDEQLRELARRELAIAVALEREGIPL